MCRWVASGVSLPHDELHIVMGGFAARPIDVQIVPGA
jgi:hypothetical protein